MSEISHEQSPRLVAYFESPSLSAAPSEGVTRDAWVSKRALTLSAAAERD